MASAYPKRTRASRDAASIPCTMRSLTSMCPLTRYLWLPWCSRLLIIRRLTLVAEAWVRLFLGSIRLVLGKSSGNRWLNHQAGTLKNGTNYTKTFTENLCSGIKSKSFAFYENRLNRLSETSLKRKENVFDKYAFSFASGQFCIY